MRRPSAYGERALAALRAFIPLFVVTSAIPAIAGDGRGGLSPSIDEVIVVSSDDAKKQARYLSAAHACCVGMSSGANFFAACKLCERFETVVTVFPDGYQRYESEGLRRCRGDCPYQHELVV